MTTEVPNLFTRQRNYQSRSRSYCQYGPQDKVKMLPSWDLFHLLLPKKLGSWDQTSLINKLVISRLLSTISLNKITFQLRPTKNKFTKNLPEFYWLLPTKLSSLINSRLQPIPLLSTETLRFMSCFWISHKN